jgi:hypothetical protein
MKEWMIVSVDDAGRKLFYSISPTWHAYPTFSFERENATARLAALRAKGAPHADRATLEKRPL